MYFIPVKKVLHMQFSALCLYSGLLSVYIVYIKLNLFFCPGTFSLFLRGRKPPYAIRKIIFLNYLLVIQVFPLVLLHCKPK